MDKPNKLPDLVKESQLIQWISELKKSYVQDKQEYLRQVLYLLDGIISQSPMDALQWLEKHRKDGIHLLPGLPKLIAKLANQLLSNNEILNIEKLLELETELHIPIDIVTTNQLAKEHMRRGNYKKARDLFYGILRKQPRSPDVLHHLYNLAKTEGRTDEAHALLNQLAQVDPSPSTIIYAYKERLKCGINTGQTVSIALISSYVINPLIPYLDLECRKAGLIPDFYLTPFNQYTQEVLVSSSTLYQFTPDVVFLAFSIEDLYPEITAYPSKDDLTKAGERIHAQVLTLINNIREHCKGLIILYEFVLMHWSPHGILDNRIPNGLSAWVEELNRILRDELQSLERVYLLPLNQVLGWTGKVHCSNPKMQYMASMRLSDAALPALARYSMRYLKPLKGLTRKCIVLDLDGTLWGGIVGEVGAEGIHLGPTAPGVEYLDFQKALLNLTHRGILLAICSKNNPEDVFPVIRDHKHMLLREERFSSIRINWRNKAENIREIANELNIGLDSIVFIDDNPTERELIKQLLPEVLTVELPTDPSYYRATLDNLADFELLAITKEDEMRVAHYQATQKRRSVRRTAASLEEYLYSLELNAEIALARPEDLNRLVQMYNKTNQFNLTTRRHQMVEMEQFLKSQNILVYTLRVSDAFGDHGLVGAAIVNKGESSWHIDSFLMSCRVMGSSIETAFLHKIYQDASEAGIMNLTGEYIPTEKNRPVEHFYQKHGFTLIKKAENHQIWEINVAMSKIQRPGWITTT